jgi:hypothetical protein
MRRRPILTPGVLTCCGPVHMTQDIDLLYASPLRRVTSCCINRFQSASRIDMPL